MKKRAQAVANKDSEKAAQPVGILDGLAARGKIPGSRGGKKLSRFLEQGDEIRVALAEGYSVKDVWEYLRDQGSIDLSYSLFSQYVRTKLQMRPRHGFEKVEVVGEGQAPPEPELTEEEKHENMLVHGNPMGRRA